MTKLEDLKEGASVKGVRPDGPITVINVKWHGDAVVELTYKDASGKPGNDLLFRDREAMLEIIEPGQSWSFDADADMLRLVSEAYRIGMAYLFDPLLAVHTSLIDPLPHQITAVYEEMLPRQPLRFLLADDPGAGKTIMAGLLIKELMVRGDLARCLIVCPGNLADQWQDELYRRLQLPFKILTNDMLETSITGNIFQEIPLLIARLDKLSRNENVQIKLKQAEWDLIICDEAHKMSASFFGGEIKETKRRKLGRLLSELTRHFLLMTATPHNGKEEDFQLFMALLDGDRFEGRFRDGVHVADSSDVMRRMVKEDLFKFDGTPLFPERLAYSVTYRLSDQEAVLYEQVTNYVREEFNRADTLENEGRKGTVGFALTILQRRLASSPESIYQSLRRRRERLESRLREEELLKRGATTRFGPAGWVPTITEEDLEDLEDATDSEVEETEEKIIDLATASQTITELQAEIQILKKLEALALQVRRSGQDKKWEELSRLLQDNSEMFDADGSRRKLVIFTEYKDTLKYLTDRITSLIGRADSVVNIHGSIGREDRRKAEEIFKQDKNVQILVATDAAGEGINLQRAHLMVNYDLPWNPNRIEQRFGRIHRIGQTEVCHLWNLVAEETREGDVYLTLLRKLEAEREALGGAVFDVLGKAIGSAELRKLMIEAIRYGDRPEVRARLTQQVEEVLDKEHLKQLLEEKALTHNSMGSSRIKKIREEMERAEARRLQPHFIASFFLKAFELLGGSLREREPKRYEIKHVPAVIRNRDRLIGMGEVVLTRYERICFEKDLISVPAKPLAAFVAPGHPLLDATTDIILERYRNLLRQGAVFVNEADPGEPIRALFYIDHSVADARADSHGNRRVVSRQIQFVEIDEQGNSRSAGYAPYLDYRPLIDEERSLVEPDLAHPWLHEDLESKAISYAISRLVPEHFQVVKGRKEERVNKTIQAVKDRLTKEIAYWDHRAAELKAQELAGKVNARINSAKARSRADELQARLHKRLEELEKERQISPLPPVVMGGALVVPGGLLARLKGKREHVPGLFARETKRVEQMAMQAVMEIEKSLKYQPRDVSKDNCGYDIESVIPESG
ncbi:MAG: helicase-related protein, partial [Thermodesulfobacteriota bacterium]|nr:helicase-related protein [Thermodesulfobacteriota bacterium]